MNKPNFHYRLHYLHTNAQHCRKQRTQQDRLPRPDSQSDWTLVLVKIDQRCIAMI